MKGVCMLSHFSCVGLFATPWPVACEAPLSMGFPRQEDWSGLPFPPPGNLLSPGIELTLVSLMSPALADGFFTTRATWEGRAYTKALRCEETSCVPGCSLPLEPPGKEEHIQRP